jgi:hypothetical protein
MFIFLGGDTLSWLPNVTITPPYDYSDTTWTLGFYWGNYNSLGDINNDDFDDFSITYCDASNDYDDRHKYITYRYFGNSNADSIEFSVDTLFTGNILQNLGIISSNEKLAMLCDYKDSLGYNDGFGISYIDSIYDTKLEYTSIKLNNLASGDINNDGFNDWCIYDNSYKVFLGPTFK